jgi:hypothetical protein
MYTYTFYSHPYLFGYFVRSAEPFGNEYHFHVAATISDTSSIPPNVTREKFLQGDYDKTNFKDLLPMAVRSTFSSLDKNYYLVERPPFQSKIDYSKNQSYYVRKPDKTIQGKDMWIPWTAMLISVPKDCTYFNQITFNLYFNDAPISSDEDFLINSFFPNSSNGSGTLCIGSTLSNITFDQPNPSIKEIVNIIYNDYFSGGWNSDISNHIRYNKAMLPALERLELNDSKNYQKTDLPSIKHSLLRSSEDHATVSTYNTNYVQFFYCYSEMTFEETMNYFNIMKQAHISGVAPVPVTSISSMSDGIDRNSSSLRTSLFSQDLSRDANVAFGCIAINDLISKNHITATCNVVISDYDPKTSDFYSYIRHPQIISDVFSRITLLLSDRGNPAYSFPYRLDYSTKDLFNNTGDIYADAF